MVDNVDDFKWQHKDKFKRHHTPGCSPCLPGAITLGGNVMKKNQELYKWL